MEYRPPTPGFSKAIIAPARIPQCLPSPAEEEFQFQNLSILANAATKKVKKAKRLRPPHPYPEMIKQAILESKNGLTQAQLQTYFCKKYPDIYQNNEYNWSSTVRYYLSSCNIFEKHPSDSKKNGNPGRKQSVWTVKKEFKVDKLSIDFLLN